MSYPCYEIFKDAKSEYRFRLVAANYKNILASEGYTTKQGCQNGIASCQENSPKDERYKRLASSNGKYYFTLNASNGQVIGVSEMYENVSGRDAGIEAVKRNGPTKNVVDNS